MKHLYNFTHPGGVGRERGPLGQHGHSHDRGSSDTEGKRRGWGGYAGVGRCGYIFTLDMIVYGYVISL